MSNLRDKRDKEPPRHKINNINMLAVSLTEPIEDKN